MSRIESRLASEPRPARNRARVAAALLAVATLVLCALAYGFLGSGENAERHVTDTGPAADRVVMRIEVLDRPEVEPYVLAISTEHAAAEKEAR